MWRVCISRPQAVMVPHARVSLFKSLLGSGLWWGQLPHPLCTRSPCPTPKPSSLSPHQGQSSLPQDRRLGQAQPSVCAHLPLCMLVYKGQGHQLTPITTHPHALTSCPPSHGSKPAQPSLLAWDSLSLPVHLPQLRGAWALPSSLPPTPHPAAVPAGPWGWLPACGCWSSSPSTSTSPQPPSSTSGEGRGLWDAAVTALAVHSHPGVGTRRNQAGGVWGGGLYFSLSHYVSHSPAVSWALRSPSASDRTPRISRWRTWPTRLVSWAGVPPGPAPLFLPELWGAPCQGLGRGDSHHAFQCPWLYWEASVEWAAVRSTLGFVSGGVSWVEGTHPPDHLPSIYRAHQSRPGGRTGPEDCADRSGRGRSEHACLLRLGQSGTRWMGCCHQE